MIAASNDQQFLGMVVNPKTHEPVLVEKKADTYRTAVIRALTRRTGPVGFYAYTAIGEGYLANTEDEEQYLAPVKASGYPRVHTPSGVQDQFRGQGFGTSLYAGVCLLATTRAEQLLDVPKVAGKGAGICSSSVSRSDEADFWWDSAVDLGLANRHDMEGEEREESEYDVDLLRYMSAYGRNEVIGAVRDQVSNNSDWYPSDISVRGDISRMTTGEPLTVDTLTYKSLLKFKLVVVLDPIDGSPQEWARRITSEHLSYASEDANKDVILALNVARQDLRLVGKLALIARELGATETQIAGMIMRQKFGYDEMVKEYEPPAFMQNPRRRKRGRHGPRHGEHGPGYDHTPAEPLEVPRTNPESPPTNRELAQLVEISHELAERRARLGWNNLEVLP